jgi:hypothetical protein
MRETVLKTVAMSVRRKACSEHLFGGVLDTIGLAEGNIAGNFKQVYLRSVGLGWRSG